MDSLFERFVDFHANLHPVVKWGGYALLATGLAAATLPTAYRTFRGWKMERNLAASQVALNDGKFTQARDLALSVVRYSPQRIEALRVFAESVYALHDPAEQDVACMMFANPAGSEADKRRAFEVIAERTPVALAGAAWSHLGEEKQRLPEYRLPFIRRLIVQSHYSEAAGLIQQIPESERPPAIESEWIRLLAHSTETSHHEEAQRRSLNFFKNNLPGTAETLQFLSAIPLKDIQPETSAAASAWLDSQPAASPATKLAAARLRFATQGDAQAAIVAEQIKLYQDSAPGPLCQWLLGLDRLDDALAVQAPASFAEDKEWFTARNAALVAAQRWKDWLANLDQPPATIPRMELAVDRAIAATKLGDFGRANMEWSSAMVEASADTTRNGFLVLAARAEAGGLSDQALAAMSQGVRLGRGPIPTHARLQPLITALANRGRGKELLQIFTALMRYEGSNPLVMVNYCYLGSLYGVIEPDFTIARMEELRAKLPDAVPVRAVLATGLLMKNEPAKAAAALEIANFDWATAAPGYRAVYGTTMFLTGKEDETARVLQGLPWENLLPRETNVFFGILSKARARNNDTSAPPWLPAFQPRAETDAREALPASPPTAAPQTP